MSSRVRAFQSTSHLDYYSANFVHSHGGYRCHRPKGPNHYKYWRDALASGLRVKNGGKAPLPSPSRSFSGSYLARDIMHSISFTGCKSFFSVCMLAPAMEYRRLESCTDAGDLQVCIRSSEFHGVKY